jgi:hypothetical protein
MFTAVIEGSLLGLSEGPIGAGDRASILRTYMLANETEVLKLYTVDRDGLPGEFYDAISGIKRPAQVRVQVEVRQDSNGKTKLRPLAVAAA